MFRWDGGTFLILDLLYKMNKSASAFQKGGEQELTYSDFKVDEFLCECAHLVIKAESVFSSLGRCEDEVPLSLLLTIHHDLVSWTNNLVINIEGTSCLDLCIEICKYAS